MDIDGVNTRVMARVVRPIVEYFFTVLTGTLNFNQNYFILSLPTTTFFYITDTIFQK